MNKIAENAAQELQMQPPSYDEELRRQRLKAEFGAKAHRDVITARLAYALIAVMGTTLCVHYFVVFHFASSGNLQAIDAVRNVFSAWLPVISGLVSAAVTYYFANGK